MNQNKHREWRRREIAKFRKHLLELIRSRKIPVDGLFVSYSRKGRIYEILYRPVSDYYTRRGISRGR